MPSLHEHIGYWNRERETLPRPALTALQTTLLAKSVGFALATPFYRERLKGAGITSASDIRSLDDLRRIPFTTKVDLRQAWPDQLLAVGRGDVVRLHTSSGTTGMPTVIYHTRADLENWTDLVARCIISIGATREDIFQNMTTYGLFTGGLGLHYGAEKIGALVIPSGSGNTTRQIQLMQAFGTTLVHATPSYLLHINTFLKQEGIDRATLSLRKGMLGAEPYSENTRLKLEEELGIDVYNSYGLSEMNGPGVSFECVYKNGMHTWEDAFILEIVDPHTLEPVADGCEGEIVFTTLQREATPLLRYRTRDLASVITQPCPCGRTHRRLTRIKGRSDDMLIVNGVNIFPSQVEAAIMQHPQSGTNYQIVIEKKGDLDRMVVNVEIAHELQGAPAPVREQFQKTLDQTLKAALLIHPLVVLHDPGTLPAPEGKAVRVKDLRPAL